MSHLVMYDGADGATVYEQFTTVDEAVSAIERLRNDGTETVRLFRLEEISLEVKAYYKVEVSGATSGVMADAAAAAPIQPVPEPVEQAAVESEPSVMASMMDELAGSNGGGARRGLFGR
ncbi:MAG: hypothetical protein ACE5GB_12975 [Acidimicrobiales bacterium]